MMLEDLEEEFAKMELPDNIEISQGVTITNGKAFVDSHLASAKANRKTKTGRVFYDRLIMFYKKIKNQ